METQLKLFTEAGKDIEWLRSLVKAGRKLGFSGGCGFIARNQGSTIVATKAHGELVALHDLAEQLLLLAANMEGRATLIAGNHQFNVVRDGEFVYILDATVIVPAESRPFTCEEGISRRLELFKFVLSRQARERLFTPAFEDLLADFHLARQARYQTKWGRRWLSLAFHLRAAGLVIRCLRTVWLTSFAGLAMYFVPNAVKLLWTQLFR